MSGAENREEIAVIFRICAGIFEILMLSGCAAFAYTALASHPNLGNLTGCALCITAFLMCLFRRPFVHLIREIWKSTGGRIVLVAICILAAAAAVTAAVIVVMIAGYADRPPDKPTTVIVLGCGMKNGGPSQMMRQRCSAAYDYMTENPDVMCIVSGGKGADEPVSEASMMSGILIEKGISPDRIIIEDRSVSTYTNLINSRELLDKYGLPHEALIVTSEYHQLRTSMLAKRAGIKTWSKSSDTMALYLPACVIREIYGVIYTFFGGC